MLSRDLPVKSIKYRSPYFRESYLHPVRYQFTVVGGKVYRGSTISFLLLVNGTVSVVDKTLIVVFSKDF